MTRRAHAFWLLALLAACGGGGGHAVARSLAYALDPAAYRVGEPISTNAATVVGCTPTSFSITPSLPPGLALDPLTGAIDGTPTAQAGWQSYSVTVQHAGGTVTGGLDLAVGTALPAEVSALAAGFVAERVATGLAFPSKMALAPDGRVFFSELKTGQVRVVSAGGVLDPTPWATLSVQGAGSHQGLLALALSPGFATDSHLYVLFSAPADGTHASDHLRLERWTESGGIGTSPLVLLDNLPTASTNNGADIVFDAAGHLCISLGDSNQPALAQDPLSPSGKVLRIAADGSIPAGNPDPSSAVWCRGLRNTFGLAVHPLTGDLFGVDNGPAADDELNYLAAGRNFGWGATGPIPGAEAGLRVRVWPTEIVPTALAWHTGTGFGADYADDLFLASYDLEQVQRLELSGTARTDIDAEGVFLQFLPSGTSHKPLDLVVASDGALWVSTFTSIYRITRL